FAGNGRGHVARARDASAQVAVESYDLRTGRRAAATRAWVHSFETLVADSPRALDLRAPALEAHHSAARLAKAHRLAGQRCAGVQEGLAPAFDLSAPLYVLEFEQI